MGFNYLVFNGAVPYEGPNDGRITKSYKARVNFCTMCHGVCDDNAKLVDFPPSVVVSRPVLHVLDTGRLGSGLYTYIQVAGGTPLPRPPYKIVAARAAPQVTKDWLIHSFDVPWVQPGTGFPFVNRMIKHMTPQNSVPCIMHGQMRVTPRMLTIMWYGITGVHPGPHRRPAVSASSSVARKSLSLYGLGSP